jgi:predicted DNA-binding transcriptional regulator YafY
MVEKRVASDAKLERLLNLVLALLGTERYLTKAEITSTIPGYEGNSESKDRMFERDKDDLRRLGIEIDVRQVDPLFEDEVGYRIRDQIYNVSIPTLTIEEGILANVALSFVADVLQQNEAQTAWLKVKAMSNSEENSLTRILSSAKSPQLLSAEFFPILLQAIQEHRAVEFLYVKDSDDTSSRRSVEPGFLIHGADGWLMRGWDRERQAHRTFLLDNMDALSLLPDSFSPKNEVLAPNESARKPAFSVVVRAPSDVVENVLEEGGKGVDEKSGEGLISFLTYNVDSLLRILISIDTRITVESPSEAAELHAALLDRMSHGLR